FGELDGVRGVTAERELASLGQPDDAAEVDAQATAIDRVALDDDVRDGTEGDRFGCVTAMAYQAVLVQVDRVTAGLCGPDQQDDAEEQAEHTQAQQATDQGLDPGVRRLARHGWALVLGEHHHDARDQCDEATGRVGQAEGAAPLVVDRVPADKGSQIRGVHTAVVALRPGRRRRRQQAAVSSCRLVPGLTAQQARADVDHLVVDAPLGDGGRAQRVGEELAAGAGHIVTVVDDPAARIFGPTAEALGVPIAAWSVVLLASAQADTYGPAPGVNMIAPVGMARSTALKRVLYSSWVLLLVSLAVYIGELAILH